MPEWYACLTRARSEKKAAERLSRKGVESWLPLLPRVRAWKDRKKVVDWPVFPSYVFCRVERDALPAVLRTPGVADVVRHDGEPARIRSEEIENVRRFLVALAETGDEPEPAPSFHKGEPVRVVRGPFRGIEGRVREVRGRKRLLVAVEGIRQGLEVDIPADALEPRTAAAAVRRSS